MIRFAMVWVGEKYGPEYPEILADMLARNASQLDAFTIECLTDRPGELPEGVNAIPAPADLPGWWAKVALFSPDMPWAEGDRIVYFDLDVAITGRLEDLVERPGIIADWHWPMFNSSAMVWDHGQHREVWERWSPHRIDRPSPPDIAALLPAGQVNGGDQEWITECAGAKGGLPWDTFPPEWFVSYRHAHAWPPSGCKAVIFHGHTKPADVPTGWVPSVWRLGGYTSLPTMNGVNVTHDTIAANIRSACARDLPWFTGFQDEGRVAVIVGGAPSMKDCLAEIKAHQRRGAQIISVNNAWRTLVAAGVTPKAHVMLDARPENAEFVTDAPAETTYFLASQCHPDVFDALLDQGREVVIWHNGVGDNATMREILDPWWDEGPNQRPCILVPGGGTVGLRALWLAHLSGFRKIHVYGMDSSYEGDQHHAYAQPLNDGEARMIVTMLGRDGREKQYLAARWMVRQSEEFRETWFDLGKEGTALFVHGRGLIPDIARALREEERTK